MKTIRLPAIVLTVLILCYLAYMAYSASLLPERVATHFDTSGQPDGWMSRSGYLIFMGALGIGAPLITVFTALISKYIPYKLINLPNKQYWLLPEHREQTYLYMTCLLLWMGCLEVIFFAGIHFLTIEANRAQPLELNMERFFILMGSFAAIIVLWLIVLIYHFKKTG